VDNAYSTDLDAVNGKFDLESRMAADIAASGLLIANDDDSRILTWEGNDGSPMSTAIDLVGAKFQRCVTQGKKILINFHANWGGAPGKFIRGAIYKYWQLARVSVSGLSRCEKSTPIQTAHYYVIICVGLILLVRVSSIGRTLLWLRAVALYRYHISSILRRANPRTGATTR
jgi:hypothetical protein